MTGRRHLWILLAIAALAGCDEIRNIHVRDYEAWKRLPDGDKSWFPDNLPPTAHDIHITYDLDTNATNVAFEISADSLGNLERKLKESMPGHVVWPRMLVNEPWWPTALNNRFYEEAVRVGLKFFTYQERRGKHTLDWGCAVDSKTLNVYFWY